MSRIPVPLLRPVTIKKLAELTDGPLIFRFGSVVGQPDKYVLTAAKGKEKINMILSGQVALLFADEIKKGVINS